MPSPVKSERAFFNSFWSGEHSAAEENVNFLCQRHRVFAFCGKMRYTETGTLKHSNRVLLLFSQLLDLSMRRYPVSDYLLRYFQTALLMELAGEFTVSEDTDSSMEIFRIQDWILHHYAQTITVSQIAEIFHYNSAYLSSLYKKTTGVPLKQYINHVRIDAAKKMLISSDSSLKEIAFRCGYTDEKYFFKVFKQLENMTPTEYREAFYKKKSTN